MTWLYWGLILALLLLGEPLFLLLGFAAISAFGFFTETSDLRFLMEKFRSLADQQTLLAIPLFMLSGNIMSKGDIAKRLMRVAQAAMGWLPGGMALAGIGACLLFASITGSSTATLVAIGGLVYPTLIREKYKEDFAIGLVTTAGSIGILVPPSIPMIIYCIFNTYSPVDVQKLWLAGMGPALLISACLGGYSVIRAGQWKIARYPFDAAEFGVAFREGLWALMLPGLILGGIYTGVFIPVEAAAVAAVYAVLVEIYFHGGLTWRDVPAILVETVVLVGSFIIIIVMAMGLGEFFSDQRIPERAAEWMISLNLSWFWFLFALDILLLVVGCLMDIMSALMLFVPLIAPMAAAVGVDPIHLGVVFIVNLEIGYLTPPVGLNLFLSASLFQKTFGQVIRYTAPFVLLMLGCLAAVTWVPATSLTLVEWVYDYQPLDPAAARKEIERREQIKKAHDDGTAPPAEVPAAPGAKKGRSLKDLMDDAEEAVDVDTEKAKKEKEEEEAADEAEEAAAAAKADGGAAPAAP